MKREHYGNFILKTLLGNDGSMERQEVIKKFENKFLHGDGRCFIKANELGDRGTETYWGNELSFARENMKIQGLLKNNSPNGLWELTCEGKKAASTLSLEDFILYGENIPSAIRETLMKIADPEVRTKVIDAMFGS